MNTTNDRDSLPAEDAVEVILGQASPRPAPPAAEMTAVRNAVEAEWKLVTWRRRSRRKFVQLAMAASVLLAVFVSLNALRNSNFEPVFVASIDKQFGQMSVQNANLGKIDAESLTEFVAGQTVTTADSSGIGLAWGNGGSLRIDANTDVKFVSPTEIYLETGRVYFDSTPLLANNSLKPKLTIQTKFGEVTHVGTQYMAHTDENRLTISVRDGQVTIQNDVDINTAGRNQQVSATAGGLGGIVNIKSFGERWEWLERTSPTIQLSKRSVSEFLDWVGQETGLEVRYGSDVARTSANSDTLTGQINTGPRQALDAWMLGTNLEWRVDEVSGVIYVDQAQ